MFEPSALKRTEEERPLCWNDRPAGRAFDFRDRGERPVIRRIPWNDRPLLPSPIAHDGLGWMDRKIKIPCSTSNTARNLLGPSDWIRTSGLLNPIQARYQTSPHPDILFSSNVITRRLIKYTTLFRILQPLFAKFLEMIFQCWYNGVMVSFWCLSHKRVRTIRRDRIVLS